MTICMNCFLLQQEALFLIVALNQVRKFKLKNIVQRDTFEVETISRLIHKENGSGHLHFTGSELKSSYLMMGVTSGHSDGHVTLV